MRRRRNAAAHKAPSALLRVLKFRNTQSESGTPSDVQRGLHSWAADPRQAPASTRLVRGGGFFGLG